MRRTGRLLASATAAAVVSLLGALPASATGQTRAAPGGAPVMRISALSFGAKSVDATSGSATVDLSWTMTSNNPDADGFGGNIHLRRMDPATGAYLGTELAVNFDSQGSPVDGVTVRPGSTGAKATYDWTVAVPQYGATKKTTWAVSEIQGGDGAGEQIDWTAPQLSAFPRTFVAVTTPDRGYPSLDEVSLAQGTQATVYDDPQHGTALQYQINSQENLSGVYGGTVIATGPGGRRASGSFAISWDWSEGYQGCGYIDWLQHEVLNCSVTVPLPAGLPEGDWTVSEVDLTSNSGVTHAYTGLTEPAVHVTSDAVLSASDFAFTPSRIDSWHSPTPTAQFALRPSGAVGGVASVELTDWGNTGQCLQLSTMPTVQADGTVTVPVRGEPGSFTCEPTGVVITDGNGDRAVYGSSLGAPAVGATLSNIPDTVLPSVDAATVTPDTVAADDTRTQIELTVDVAASTAGVDALDLYLVDSTGSAAPIQFGGVTTTFSGPLTEYFNLPQGTAPGTYTLAFTLQDQDYKTVSYGLPGAGSQPLPGGPLTLTVTAPPAAGGGSGDVGAAEIVAPGVVGPGVGDAAVQAVDLLHHGGGRAAGAGAGFVAVADAVADLVVDDEGAVVVQGAGEFGGAGVPALEVDDHLVADVAVDLAVGVQAGRAADAVHGRRGRDLDLEVVGAARDELEGVVAVGGPAARVGQDAGDLVRGGLGGDAGSLLHLDLVAADRAGAHRRTGRVGRGERAVAGRRRGRPRGRGPVRLRLGAGPGRARRRCPGRAVRGRELGPVPRGGRPARRVGPAAVHEDEHRAEDADQRQRADQVRPVPAARPVAPVGGRAVRGIGGPGARGRWVFSSAGLVHGSSGCVPQVMTAGSTCHEPVTR
ncbi:hypothetical protein GA0115240_167212 [Streptomyces sp. DvalAA-14]|nr:hypothetical protein GA0115240_167212 [Streptomyces sp. DvalAA-14]